MGTLLYLKVSDTAMTIPGNLLRYFMMADTTGMSIQIPRPNRRTTPATIPW
ncbi:MAG: hypothetical protein KDA76_16260 [Planctomycetaceae bacterium]|nr:hypothetical protein [Planctomycetaceae bacterium]